MMKNGLCIGGPLDGEIRLSDEDYFQAYDLPPPDVIPPLLEVIPVDNIKIYEYRKLIQPSGAYHWVVR